MASNSENNPTAVGNPPQEKPEKPTDKTPAREASDNEHQTEKPAAASVSTDKPQNEKPHAEKPERAPRAAAKGEAKPAAEAKPASRGEIGRAHV